MVRTRVPVDVIWDGIRVYRVPSAEEIETILLLAEGHSAAVVSEIQGLSVKNGAHRRMTEAQVKTRALSPSGALYQLYRLQLVPNPRNWDQSPVLNAGLLPVVHALTVVGLPYDRAHKVLGMGETTLVRRMNEIKQALGASNRAQVLRRAVETGDVQVDTPSQLWRGQI